MAPTLAARERAMKFRDVLVQAMNGRLTWWQAAEILGVTARTMRRWRRRYQQYGVSGLQDRRRVDRSPHGVPEAEVKRWLRLYRERYGGFNVRHFYARMRRDQGCVWSYTVVRRALQSAGLVKPKRPRGRHFTRRTQVGRALERLGVEHILAYSPQARGRSERVNRTLQDRLVKELHRAGIRTLERANRYLVECFLPAYNDEFARPPAHPESGFAPCGAADLEAIFCHEEGRTVQRDNTVTLEGVRLQIAKQPGRATCAGLAVIVRRHLDGTHTVSWGPKLLGRYSPQGRALSREPILHSTPAAQATAVA